jgi:hypothetical protein
VVGYRCHMPRTLRSSIPAPVLGLLVLTLAFGLSACGGDDDPVFEDETSASESPSKLPEADPSDASKSCQAIIGSGAVEDIQAVFDKYKDNSKPFTTADAKRMRDALDLLAKAGDNATPKIREDVVTLVADAGSLIDSRAGLPGVGKVATPQEIQREIDALCR